MLNLGFRNREIVSDLAELATSFIGKAASKALLVAALNFPFSDFGGLLRISPGLRIVVSSSGPAIRRASKTA